MLDKMPEPNKLFVYGTLRQGFGNHRLMQGADFLGEATIPAQLFVNGWLPMIGPPVAEGDVVHGEVYRLFDAYHWAMVDGLESHPSWYRREIVTATYKDRDAATPVWAYFMPHLAEYPMATLVESGDYRIAREGT